MYTEFSIAPVVVGTAPQPPLEMHWTHLRDGTPVLIRPIQPTDLELECQFVNRLSPQTRYRRLLSGRRLSLDEMRRLTNIDPAREIALIAVAHINGVERELGVARCVRYAENPRECDFAIVIDDAYQHQGLGLTLMRQLMRKATEADIEVFGGITLSDNRPMLTLARKLGFRVWRETGDATMTHLEARLDRAVNMINANTTEAFAARH